MKNCLIIYNDITISSNQPIDLGNWIIEKPREEDLSFISEHFNIFVGPFGNGPFQEKKIIRDNKSWRMDQLLDKKDYRYLVVKSKLNEYSEFGKIKEAFRLSSSDLWAESELSDNNGMKSISCDGYQMNGYFGFGRATQKPISVDWKQIEELILLREEFKESEHPEVVGAIQMFKDNDGVRDSSHLKHLGYFAIIESLLSHKPAANDSIDSISRQLTRNIILLNNREAGGTDLVLEGFGLTRADKIISKLYSYRSDIAHGGKGIEALRQLSDLRIELSEHEHWNKNSKDWIAWYLRNLVKGILIHSLREPQLIKDLK